MMEPTARGLRLLGQVMFSGRDDYDPAHLLGEANLRLVTHQLNDALSAPGRGAAMPEDASSFLAEVSRRNRERNRRLLQQLVEATCALNAAGLTPVLLKGAVRLALEGDGCSRILSDIDLMVSPEDGPAACAALDAAGIGVLARYPEGRRHVIAEYGDAWHVGCIDVHQRPPGPPGFVEYAALTARARKTDVHGVQVWIPSAADQIVLYVLHDMFHDGGYWTGRLDLRHLIDVRQAIEAGGEDAPGLALALCPTRLSRAAMRCFLRAARTLVGAQVDPALLGLGDRLDFRRMSWQDAAPIARPALAGLTVILNVAGIAEQRRAIRQAAAIHGFAAIEPGDRKERYLGILSRR